MKRAFIMVLDSFGIGATEDAERFGDVGADTLGHIAEACAKGEADNGRKGPLNLPNLTRLGLAKAHEGSTGFIPAGMDGNAEVIGAYAWAHEMSSGKDTPSGHWEIAGVPVTVTTWLLSRQHRPCCRNWLMKNTARWFLSVKLQTSTPTAVSPKK